LQVGQFRNAFIQADELEQTWFVSLFRNLADGIRREDVDRIFENVAFVVFNYDRCVEHFLHNALQAYYGIMPDEASGIMRTLKIYHRYGTISPLPWQASDGIPFGAEATQPNLLEMISRIRTYTEVVDSDLVREIQRVVANSRTLVFLGFSYQDENMRLLGQSEPREGGQIYGTAYGISLANTADIRNTVGEMFPASHVGIQNLKCFNLLEDYSRMLFAPGQRRG
jgi:hypothetical protein